LKTMENLRDAFAGESQANRKYLAFAKKAEQEGYPQAARLFRAAAEAETIHAHSHLRIMGGIKSTQENLQEAIGGETFEFTKMYPDYIKVASAEEKKDAEWSFNVANKVEEIHAGLYRKVADALKAGKDVLKVDYYVCGVCGNTVEGQAPDKCPVCGASKTAFKLIS